MADLECPLIDRMISVLLLILKIIGITLLVIFGLILFLLLLVLFVPIDYRVRIIRTPKKTQINGRVSFLFPLFFVTVQYLEGVSYKVKVFGYAMLNSEKAKQPKKEKKTPSKEKVRIGRKQKQNVGADTAKTEQTIESSTKETQESKQTSVKTQETMQEQPVHLQSEEVKEGQQTKEQSKETKKQTKKKEKKQKQQKEEKEKRSLKERLEQLKQLWHRKQEIQQILGREGNRQAISFVFAKVKRLFRHILPRKCSGFLAYGSSDPCTTGKVLGIVSMLYAKTGEILEIRPNFEEEQLECDIECKGHIQLFTLAFLAGTVFFHKQLRKMIKEIKQVFRTET